MSEKTQCENAQTHDAPDLFREDIISIADAAKEVPGGVHTATMHRWRRFGINGVKLGTIKIGSRCFTTRESVRRFLMATQEVAS